MCVRVRERACMCLCERERERERELERELLSNLLMNRYEITERERMHTERCKEGLLKTKTEKGLGDWK